MKPKIEKIKQKEYEQEKFCLAQEIYQLSQKYKVKLPKEFFKLFPQLKSLLGK